MNLYFLVEGRRTESKVYPSWIRYLLPSLTRVRWANEVIENNYVLFSGFGYPSLLHNHLENSIEECNSISCFDYLIVILDVDEMTVQYRENEVLSYIQHNNINIGNYELVVIPQNRCIESWFLGNSKVFKSNPTSSELSEYIKFYNVKDNDPEEMGKLENFNTHAQFHADYCKKFLAERNIIYTKRRPGAIVEEIYLNELINRSVNTNHIQSFKKFIDFCNKIKS